jgi:methionine--tRNA ligase beta chain
MITYEDFSKLEIKIGTILSAEKVAGADKLVLLKVDLGEDEPRQVVAGILKHFPDPEVLVGKQVPIVANLQPRTMLGHESRGMILAASKDPEFSLLVTEENVTPGSFVK